MPKSWKLALVVIPCVAILLACGGVGAVSYNNSMVEVTKDLEIALKTFEADRTMAGNDHGKVQKAHDVLLGRSDTILKRGRALTPPDTPEGKNLHTAFLAFLTEYEQTVRVEFANVVRLEAEGNMAEILAIGERVHRKLEEKEQNLRTAQQNFAKANNLKIQ